MGMAVPRTPIETAQDLGPRLEAARVAHRDAQEVAHRAAEKFRRTIVEALDAGMTQERVAQLAGVTRARLHQIVVREYSRP